MKVFLQKISPSWIFAVETEWLRNVLTITLLLGIHIFQLGKRLSWLYAVFNRPTSNTIVSQNWFCFYSWDLKTVHSLHFPHISQSVFSASNCPFCYFSIKECMGERAVVPHTDRGRAELGLDSSQTSSSCSWSGQEEYFAHSAFNHSRASGNLCGVERNTVGQVHMRKTLKVKHSYIF